MCKTIPRLETLGVCAPSAPLLYSYKKENRSIYDVYDTKLGLAYIKLLEFSFYA